MPRTLCEICLDTLAHAEAKDVFTLQVLERLSQSLTVKLFTAIVSAHTDSLETWLLFVSSAPVLMRKQFRTKSMAVKSVTEAVTTLSKLSRTGFPEQIRVMLRIYQPITAKLVMQVLSLPRISELDFRRAAWTNDLDEIDRVMKCLSNAMMFGALQHTQILRLPPTGPPYLRKALKRDWPSLEYIQTPIKPDTTKNPWRRCRPYECVDQFILTIEVGKNKAEEKEMKWYKRV